ncbi:Low-affinity iron/zinc ion transport protein fet4 [Schizosaccharomyces pombe]
MTASITEIDSISEESNVESVSHLQHSPSFEKKGADFSISLNEKKDFASPITEEIPSPDGVATPEPETKKKLSFGARVWDLICSPGRQHDVCVAAPTQLVRSCDDYANSASTLVTNDDGTKTKVDSDEKKHKHKNVRDYIRFKHVDIGGRIFDLITRLAGTSFTFILMLIILIIWAIVGGIYRAPDNWQIVMQDGSSIQCYVSDTLLMRQQQNQHIQVLTMISQLRSRLLTTSRLLGPVLNDKTKISSVNVALMKDDVGDAEKLPTENWFDFICNYVSFMVGSIIFLVVYWIGIFIWIGFGRMLGWSDEWQLYINTAVAVELTFTSVFLQNVRHRHMKYIDRCVTSIFRIDSVIEEELRRMMGDKEPNEEITIKMDKINLGERSIDYYADLIGSGVGVVVSTCVFVAWIAIGNVMHWDSNWWLIIGTYTGLVGFLDGFVLRNVYFRESSKEATEIQTLINEDYALYQKLDLPLPHEHITNYKSTFGGSLSQWIGWLCALPISVLFSVFVILGLIIAAGSLRFNETAQLFCNTPTMIIEGALLIVLIEAHNIANLKRRIQFRQIHLRRLTILKMLAGDNYSTTSTV